MSDEKKYKVLTPKTSFGLKPTPQKDDATARLCASASSYSAMRDASEGRDFVLHDGPPYANGNIHLGHALNKILKDLTNRYRYISGRNINYIPGWDCHGLPIEWKVEEAYRKAGKNKDDDLIAFRADCRTYAQEWVDIQREEFKQLGVVADWDNAYTTMSYDNEASIVQQLHKFMMADLLTQKNKPIMWSPIEKTSLAEAEVDYHDVKTNTAYVSLGIKSSLEYMQGAEMLIWTTTPWTLPGNKAVAYNNEIEYSVITAAGQKYLIATALVDDFQQACEVEVEIVASVKNKHFERISVMHPVYNQTVPLLDASFVTDEQGTGFVHIAPGHGMDDFDLGLEHGLSTDSVINDNGCYVDGLPVFQGIHVYKANDEILEYLTNKGNLVATREIVHSYPHSWRSKKPVIYRTTPQWFIEVEKFNERSLEAIDDVNWFPQSGRNRLYNMVKGRTDWCISRQRAWGVPIMLFVNIKTGEVLKDYTVNEKIVQEVAEHGCDIWFEKEPSYFIEGYEKAKQYRKVADILDVWFDSGASHSFVLNNKRADVYLEGTDQHRGWFQSSLLLSTALGGTAPYKDVVTHGFIMANKGEKMSKSEKNGVTPQKVSSQYGVDTLRMWVAMSDFTVDMSINNGILQQMHDHVKKFRNTMRYCLGNLHDTKTVAPVAYGELPALEKYIVNRMVEVRQNIDTATELYQYAKIATMLLEFCNELSSFYFDIRKDCLYCDAANTPKRQATLYVLSMVFDFLSVYLAPMMPCSVYEANVARGRPQAFLTQTKDSVDLPIKTVDPHLMNQWSYLKSLRQDVLSKLEDFRQDGKIKASLEANVRIEAPAKDMHYFDNIALNELFIVSVSDVYEHASRETVIGVNINSGNKCPRCWVYHKTEEDLCVRCGEIENHD